MQSRAVVTLTVPVPPVAVNDDVEFVTETWHRSDVGAVVDVSAELQERWKPAAIVIRSPAKRNGPRMRYSDRQRLMHAARQLAGRMNEAIWLS